MTMKISYITVHYQQNIINIFFSSKYAEQDLVKREKNTGVFN